MVAGHSNQPENTLAVDEFQVPSKTHPDIFLKSEIQALPENKI